MQLGHQVERKLGEIAAHIFALVVRLEPRVRDIEQEGRSRSSKELAQEFALAHLVQVDAEVARDLFHHQRPAERLLQGFRVRDVALEHLPRVDGRENVVHVVAAILGDDTLAVLGHPR